MSPDVDDTGGSRHRPPGTGAERDRPAGAGPPRRSGSPSAVGTDDAAVFAGVGRAGSELARVDTVDGEGAGTGGAAGDEQDALTVARRERDEYLEMVRRVQADFENYKKRMVRQQTDQLERATENLVAKLLPALDAFDLTRAHLHDEDSTSAEVKALLQASGLISDALVKEGLERIDDAGAPFDPTVHDAVEHAPAASVDASAGDPASAAGGTDDPDSAAGPVVADVLRPGYRWKGRVIRPAMVRVRG
ncbi:MAG TPA: nucleotide exchange factor GrpE [Acidimicrobiales bacterium]|nr:nucleotide exchange factor GrpE [Acidimicrobiales bacterium]